MRGTSFALAALLALSLPSSRADAHLGHEIARAERYLKFDVGDDEARVVVSLTLGPAEGARVLASADTNGDRTVSEAERDAYLAQWADGLRAELPLSVDGEPRPLTWSEPYMDPIGSVRPAAVTVEMVAHVELGGRRTLRLQDRMVRRDVFDRTDVSFQVRDRARLVASGIGEDVDTPTRDLFYGPELSQGEPVVLTAIVETPERPGEMPWALLAIVVLPLLLVLVLVLRARAQRRKG